MRVQGQFYSPSASNQQSEYPGSNGLIAGLSVLLIALLTMTICSTLFGLLIFARWLYQRSQYSQGGATQVRVGVPPGDTRQQQKPGVVVPTTSISLSSPDLLQPQRGESGSRYGKTVIKQQTMPSMTHRHLSFHRQLSHRLDQSSSSSAPPLYYTDQLIQAESSLSRDQSPCLSRDTSDESLAGSRATSSNFTHKNGRLYISLRHDDNGLAVLIHRAEGLPPRDFSGTADPYVKVSLLPDKKAKRQTKVHRKTLNPVFDEQFVFSLPPINFDSLNSSPGRNLGGDAGGRMRETNNCVLQLGVYDFDRFSRHDLIGVCFVRDLFTAEFKNVERHYVLDIIAVQQCGEDLGDLMLALRYLPTAGRLTVTIMKARNLRQTDTAPSNATSGVYVKITLMCRGRRIKKRKTSTRKGTLCPVFNDSVVFDVPQDSVDEVSLVIKVFELDSTGKSEVLGVCGVGPRYVVGRGREHWLSMLENPRRSVAQWYPLQDRLMTSSGNSDVPNIADSDVTTDSACQTSNSDTESLCSQSSATTVETLVHDDSSTVTTAEILVQDDSSTIVELENDDDNGKLLCSIVDVDKSSESQICDILDKSGDKENRDGNTIPEENDVKSTTKQNGSLDKQTITNLDDVEQGLGDNAQSGGHI